MKKLSPKQKLYLLRKSRRKTIKRNKNFRKEKYKATNSTLKSFERSKRQEELNYLNSRKRIINKTAPVKFSIQEDPQAVVGFINELKEYVSVSHLLKAIRISLNEIESIDIGTICMLLSIMEEFTMKGVNFSAIIKNDHKCLPIIKKSGFLSHMTEITGTSKVELETENIILKRGRHQLDSARTGVLIRKAMKKLTGVKRHYQPIYNMIGEIALNSFEHAYIGEPKKHWFFSIYYDDEKEKIIFVFADNGHGILNTLESTFSKTFFLNLNLTKRTEILKKAFRKKYGSRFDEQPNKGKGLPSILDKFAKGYINGLLVITNDVLINYENKNSLVLRKSFSGTFYYWELDKKCVDLYTNERQNDI